MIRLIKGELMRADAESVIIEAGGLGYEVVVPEIVAERLAARGPGAQVTLHIYHYLAIEHSRGTPVLLGFDSPAQLELFEKLLNVPRVGPRQAARMLVAPVSSLARAVELGDVKFLQSLPGVGATKARDIVNALRGKLAGFLGADEELPEVEGPLEPDMQRDAIDVLVQLGFSLAEARQRVLNALTQRPETASVDELVAQALHERR